MVDCDAIDDDVCVSVCECIKVCIQCAHIIGKSGRVLIQEV